MALIIHHQMCWINGKQSRISTYIKEGYIKLSIGVPAPIEDDVYDDRECSNKEYHPLTEYTVSRVPGSGYLTMIQTYGAGVGPMAASTWCDPVGTWLDYEKAEKLHYDEMTRDEETRSVVIDLYNMLKKTEKSLAVADSLEKLFNTIMAK